ncbi:MAG: SUMF1/EgtB/PvdO family nonheme iron enzyme [Saprospiraceae bacterium]
MRNISISALAIVIVASLFSACSTKETGQLVGVTDRPKYNGINPYGMEYIPSASFHIGQTDQDIFNSYMQRPMAVSTIGFYMDDTEITNNEYRQFVNWVRDSIAHSTLEHFVEDDAGNQKIDWDYEIDWADEGLGGMYFQGDDMFGNSKEIDTRKLIYKYDWKDWDKAASPSFKGKRNEIINREEVSIYPDTLVWIRDFAYSYNEPFTRNYFWHPAFDDYPVVGVNWKMAKAFGAWRTNLWNTYKGEDEPNTEEFRLPTEHEWEYAARGGHDLVPYPWGAYGLRNAKGCLLANFKPGRGNYPEDGGHYTVKSDAYFPNDFGLYNMSGNVAEWTETAFFENAQSFIHDENPNIKYDAKPDDPAVYKRKVIRGGSWKDVAYYLQTGTRNWEYQDTTKSYIGFRCALTFLGRSINDTN